MTKLTVSVGLLFAALLCSTLLFATVSASQGSAQAAIASAKKAIVNAYASVLQAESAEANVNSLIIALNDAANLLSKAELAYSAQDYDSAYSYASQSQSKLAGVAIQADELKQTALSVASQNLLFTFLSLIVSIAVLFAGIGVWALLSKRDARNIDETAVI
ncbi:MAG: hypothetical protein M1540_08265 [Candidatus Bathyarchaeota archaeon]|nr:hypothetical protein [Candidatus Bathyarchaeota archaeon]